MYSKKNDIKKCKRGGKKWTEDEMICALKSSNSIASVLRKVGLSVRPGNYTTVNNFIKKMDIDISHMDPFRKESASITFDGLSIDSVLVENSSYSRSSLKRKLIKNGILKNECSICKIKYWNENELVMVLDHINGRNDDNRLENLRFLCPNCNSQQKTFCRGSVKHKKNRYFCQKCGQIRHRTSKQCKDCSNKSKRKSNRPSAEELSLDIESMSFVAIGKKYGVSDNSIRKWARSYGLLR